MRATRSMFLAALAMIGLVSTMTIAALFAVASDTRGPPYVEAPESSATTAADASATRTSSLDAQLEADLDMTRFMSQPSGPWAPMVASQMPNSQLQRSQDPAYVRQLEQLQADIDRMLASPG